MEEYVFIEDTQENSYMVVEDRGGGSTLLATLSYHDNYNSAYGWAREYTAQQESYIRVYVVRCLCGFHYDPQTRRK